MAASRVSAWVATSRFWVIVRRRFPWLATAVALTLVASLLVATPASAVVEPDGLPVGAKEAPGRSGEGAAQPLPPSSTEDSQGRRGPGLPDKQAKPRREPKLARPRDPVAVEAGLLVAPTGNRVSAVKEARRTGRPVEDEAARTPTSTELVNPDGSVTRVLYMDTAFVPDPESGGLRPVSTVLEQESDGYWAPEAASESRFAPSADADVLASVALPDQRGRVGFSMAGAAKAAGVIPEGSDGTRLHYPGVFPDTDLFVSATPEGVKDELVLASPAAPTSFTFPLDLPAGVTPQARDDGSVELVDARGTTVAVVQPGFMYDSSVDPRHGGPAISTNVTYTVERTDAGPRAEAEGAAGAGVAGRARPSWVLRMDVDEQWLADPARVWPITIDPSISFGAGTDDLFVSSRDYAGTNTSGFTDLTIGTYDWGGEKAASYLHFDVSDLSGQVVAGAELKLWNSWSFNCTKTRAWVYEVTQNWSAQAYSWPGP
mgnify:CR=1 FL=1